ncbi:MAG: GMC oxidoreductase [Sphingobium sp.]
MPLPYLTPATAQVEFQRTSLTLDVIARLACNTLDEALGNGGGPFDFVVVGSGMYGAYTAAKLVQLGQRGRVLVLDSGPFLLGEHVQNLSRIGYGVFRPVEGAPYISNVPIAPHYYCVGGKGLAWGKWSPRLLPSDLAVWPSSTAGALGELYPVLEEEMGVVPSSDFLFGDLQDELMRKFKAAGAPHDLAALLPPVAAQAEPPASGLYSFDAFSSLPLLVDAVRADAEAAGFADSRRRVFLVPNSRAVGFSFDRNLVTALHVHHAGESTVRTIPLGSQTKLILALGSMETTRLVMNSLGPGHPVYALAGRNLMVHLRSNLDVRISRAALNLAADALLLPAAVHLQGDQGGGGKRFHIQVFAATDMSRNPEAMLYRMVPDLDSLKALLANQRDDWVTFRVLTVGEMTPSPDKPRRTPGTSWCEPAEFDFDVCGDWHVPKLYAHFDLSDADQAHWDQMDRMAIKVMQDLAGGSADIEFLVNGQWQGAPPADIRTYRTSLGSTFHESGTLWMGDDPQASVTDSNGRFHAFLNLYAMDQSIFPSVGSANPVLTGLALARNMVANITHDTAMVAFDAVRPPHYGWKQPAPEVVNKVRERLLKRKRARRPN